MNYKLFWIVPKDDYINPKSLENTYNEYKTWFKIFDIDFSFISMKHIDVKIEDDLGLYLNGNNLIDGKTAFIISPPNLNSQGLNFSLTLKRLIKQSRNALILNQKIADIDDMEWDKSAQHLFVHQLSVPTLPLSLLGYGCKFSHMMGDFSKNNNHPLMLKPNGSGMGFGIIKSDTFQQSISTAELISTSNLIYNITPYIEGVIDVRLFFLKKELIFIKTRSPVENGYLGNTAFGGKQVIYEKRTFNKTFFKDFRESISKEIIRNSEIIMNNSGADIISIDWLVKENQFYFNEMCTAETGLTKLPENIALKVFGNISSYIKDKLC
ncbi:hypothetical protein [Photorhabdus heterorhabditis]|uniref:hypothetical protein n=1 Tax=Photorhabdus heterorhabditis TaxID=880156 RepID=UPI001BD6AA47|nr:hypothetical protein [Photorhabdus heterorhabditis]MBS9443989.1 hypothetical protein [Photorhabdus heterorhabditis]